ncbi:MAG: S8 family serine peptidase, partial [Deltaproteobacteria bacterium]|nr:S8 family serine peptidase [Deltaproteobacteria bacterium]
DAANIISVAATDALDQKASFSNYGKTMVDLGAPGVAVFSTLPNNLYGTLNGTSMATPHVAGAAALIWAYKPTLSVYDLKDLMLNTVDHVDSMKETTVSGGRLNVYNAMAFSLLSF